MCFHKFSEKSSKLTHDLATDKLKTYPKIVKKSLQNTTAKSLQKVSKKSAHILKLQQQVCKIKKASLQK